MTCWSSDAKIIIRTYVTYCLGLKFSKGMASRWLSSVVLLRLWFLDRCETEDKWVTKLIGPSRLVVGVEGLNSSFDKHSASSAATICSQSVLDN